MRRLASLLPLLLLVSGLAQAELVKKPLDYADGETTLKGWLVYDDAISGKRPGVLVVHEWWGQNDYPRDRAEMLAEMGYVALAVDMYGDGANTEHPKEAGAFAGAVRANLPLMSSRFNAGLELLKAQPQVDAERIAAIGYCFGGGVVLEMARQGVDLAGVVSFHGSLGADHRAGKGEVKAAVLVAHGADDSFIPETDITALKDEMANADADFEFLSYPGAKHGFTNPDADRLAAELGLGIGYDETADKESWAAMQAFFDRIFGKS